MKYMKKSATASSLIGTAQRPESFEEWQARVGELDRAVRVHLRVGWDANWRRIDVPCMLGDWKADRCETSYLSLTERFMRILVPFAVAGSLSPRVVEAHLQACEVFLRSQVPLLPQEERLSVVARRLLTQVQDIQDRGQRAA